MKKQNPENLSTIYVSALDELLDSASVDAVETITQWYDAIPDHMKAMGNQIQAYISAPVGTRVDVLKKLRSLTESFQSPALQLTGQDLSSSTLRKKLGLTHLGSKQIDLPVDFSHFDIKKEDTLFTRYKKRTFCRRAGFKRRMFRLSALFRKQNKNKTLHFIRSFDGRSFVQVNFWIPFENLMLNEWNLYNRAASTYFFYVKKCLDEEVAPGSGHKNDSIHILESARKEYFTSKREAKKRIHERIETLVKQTRDDLEIVGTILKPQRKFGHGFSSKKHKPSLKNCLKTGKPGRNTGRVRSWISLKIWIYYGLKTMCKLHNW